MKPLQINFIRDERWKLVLSVTAVFVASIVLACGWQIWQLQEAKSQVDGQIRSAQLQVMQVKAHASTTPNPGSDSMLKAKALLSQDLNKAFGPIEGMEEKGVRLIAVDFDAGSGSIKLTYDLETIDKTHVVSTVLNGGYTKAPWRLEGVASTGIPNASSSTVFVAVYRGSWVANIAML